MFNSIKANTHTQRLLSRAAQLPDMSEGELLFKCPTCCTNKHLSCCILQISPAKKCVADEVMDVALETLGEEGSQLYSQTEAGGRVKTKPRTVCKG